MPNGTLAFHEYRIAEKPRGARPGLLQMEEETKSEFGYASRCIPLSAGSAAKTRAIVVKRLLPYQQMPLTSSTLKTKENFFHLKGGPDP
jgi:hypothetical protein